MKNKIEKRTSMFSSIRIQITHPCKAHCEWCNTWRKNNRFQELCSMGKTKQINDIYLKLIESFQPQTLYISGGEPILYPDIKKFLKKTAPFVKEKINIFTSFQFRNINQIILSLDGIPWEKVILTHTTAAFQEKHWNEMTGFPFSIYVNNMKLLSKLPWKKEIKFIVNHSIIFDELKKFKEIINPDLSFDIRFKLMNIQANEYGKNQVKTSINHIFNLKYVFNQFFNKYSDFFTGFDLIENIVNDNLIKSCIYKSNPIELRFAYYKHKDSWFKFKYRFCPFFPSNKYFVYKTDRDSISTIISNFKSKKWHKWCKNCRIKNYFPKNYHDKSKLIENIIINNQRGIILEISACRGIYTKKIAEKSKFCVHTVNSQVNYRKINSFSNEFIEGIGEFINYSRIHQIASNIKFHSGNSTIVSKTWNQPIWMLFFNTTQPFEDMKIDFCHFEPYLIDSAFIIVENYQIEGAGGVTEFCEELINSQKYQLEYSKYGLIIFKKIN